MLDDHKEVSKEEKVPSTPSEQEKTDNLAKSLQLNLSASLYKKAFAEIKKRGRES